MIPRTRILIFAAPPQNLLFSWRASWIRVLLAADLIVAIFPTCSECRGTPTCPPNSRCLNRKPQPHWPSCDSSIQWIVRDEFRSPNTIAHHLIIIMRRRLWWTPETVWIRGWTWNPNCRNYRNASRRRTNWFRYSWWLGLFDGAINLSSCFAPSEVAAHNWHTPWRIWDNWCSSPLWGDSIQIEN